MCCMQVRGKDNIPRREIANKHCRELEVEYERFQTCKMIVHDEGVVKLCGFARELSVEMELDELVLILCSWFTHGDGFGWSP